MESTRRLFMKRAYIILSLILWSLFLSAQNPVQYKWADLGFISDTRKLNLVIDYSSADILGDDFVDFVAGEANWGSYEPEIRSKFIRAFNEEADDGAYPHRLGNYPDADYTMIIHVLKVDDRGSNVKGTMDIVGAVGDVLFTHNVEGNQGRFGSVCNLMGDAFTEMGEDIGQEFFFHARRRIQRTWTRKRPVGKAA